MTVDQLVAGIISLMGLFFTFQGSSLFGAKIRQIKEVTKNQTVKNTLDSIEDTVADVVVYVKTTMVDQIKAASSDGKLTKDEIAEIVSSAKARIFSIVQEDALLILGNVVNDVDAWIENKIEKHVELSKHN